MRTLANFQANANGLKWDSRLNVIDDSKTLAQQDVGSNLGGMKTHKGHELFTLLSHPEPGTKVKS